MSVQEKLIELVRECPCLYDECEKNYSDNAKKELMWKRIGRQLNLSASDCKKKWNNIRLSFRRAMKNRKARKEGGQPADKFKRWKYEEEIAFLLPHLKQIENNAESDHDSGEEIEVPDSPTAARESNSGLPFARTEDRPETPKEAPKILKPQHPKMVPPPEQTYPLTALMRQHMLDAKTQGRPQDVEAMDDVDYIFLCLAATVKRFSPYMRAIAKGRLNSIVSELEIDELKLKRCDSRPPSTADRVPPFEHSSRCPTTSIVMSSELPSSFDSRMQSRTEQKCSETMRYYEQLPIEVHYGDDDENNDVDSQE